MLLESSALSIPPRCKLRLERPIHTSKASFEARATVKSEPFARIWRQE